MRSAIGRRRAAGFELTFTAPARFGVAWALAGERPADVIDAAQSRSVAAAIGLSCKLMALFSVLGGPLRNGDKGIIVAAFRHHSTQFGEPKLHDHVLVVLAGNADGPRRAMAPSAALFASLVVAAPTYSLCLRSMLRNMDGVTGTPLSKEIRRALAPPRWRVRRPRSMPADADPQQLVTIAQLRRSWRETAKRAMPNGNTPVSARAESEEGLTSSSLSG